MKIIHLVAAIGIGLLSIWFLEFSKPEGAILSVLVLIYLKIK